ncbi:MAG: hypothetical protein KKA65_02125 [Nanoarchaeota archaeon]|nr:hypothetical protein [Nanoarchaeota archaeon]MBU4352522.1 hypothetical protein [Nanoarchaeota archaeon]MBU4456273.1 hypothetical protein [Nanoarchaeota archaeon]MCG2720266.1 hypothetical protein [Nanoarchaeota archaeon]
MKPDILNEEKEVKVCTSCKPSGDADKNIDKKINWLIGSLIVLLLLFALTVYVNDKTGFLFDKKVNHYWYSNGDSEFEIIKSNFQNYEGWDIKFYFPNDPNPYLIDFRNDPLSIEDIEIDRKSKNLIMDDSQVFLTWDRGRNYTLLTTFAGLDLIKVISNPRLYWIPVNTSFTTEYENFLVKTCQDGAEKETVIYFNVADETFVRTEGHCILIQGKTEEDLLRAADRLALLLLGIMN